MIDELEIPEILELSGVNDLDEYCRNYFHEPESQVRTHMFNLMNVPRTTNLCEINKHQLNDFIQILPSNEMYKIVLNNFLTSTTIKLPHKHKLLINDVWYVLNENNHGRESLFAYPRGFENYNEMNSFPLLTAPFQLGELTGCRNHNRKYNGKFSTQIVIANNQVGLPDKHKLSFTAHFANDEKEAMIQVIYMLNVVYHNLKQYFKIPSEKKQINFSIEFRIMKLLDRNVNKFTKNYLLTHDANI